MTSCEPGLCEAERLTIINEQPDPAGALVGAMPPMDSMSENMCKSRILYRQQLCKVAPLLPMICSPLGVLRPGLQITHVNCCMSRRKSSPADRADHTVAAAVA